MGSEFGERSLRESQTKRESEDVPGFRRVCIARMAGREGRAAPAGEPSLRLFEQAQDLQAHRAGERVFEEEISKWGLRCLRRAAVEWVPLNNRVPNRDFRNPVGRWGWKAHGDRLPGLRRSRWAFRSEYPVGVPPQSESIPDEKDQKRSEEIFNYLACAA